MKDDILRNVGRGVKDKYLRGAIWTLIGRGEIFMTKDWKLVHKKFAPRYKDEIPGGQYSIK